MSETTSRIFEFNDGKSSKFWEVTQSGSTVKVRFGKTGTNGQSQEKVLADESAATKHVQKLIAEKTGKGYVEQGTNTVTSVDAAGAIESKEPAASEPAKAEAKQKAVKSVKPKSPVQDPGATPQSLMTFLDKDDATNRLLAKHPRASAELLEKLSHSSDKATRQAVAGNPGTPPETYVRLGQQFPKEFLANPALDLLLLEKPGLMEQVPEALLIRLLKQADCPASLLTWAAVHKLAKVQLAVAMNASSPQAALERLRQSEHQVVREAVRGIGSVTTSEQDSEALFKLAMKERLGSLRQEAIDAWRNGDIGLPQWPYLSPTIRLEVLGTEWGSSFIRSPFLPRGIWEELASATDRYLPTILCDLAWSPSAPPDRLPGLLKNLSENSDTDVLEGIARHPGLTSDQLQRLLVDSGDGIVPQAASNPNVPIDVMRRLAASPSDEVRVWLASNPKAPLDVLEQLLEDISPYVQNNVCANPAMPEDLATSKLVQLLDIAKEDSDLAEMVAANPRAVRMQLDELLRIYKDDAWTLYAIRVAAATNPSAKPELLRLLSRQSRRYHDLYLAIASHPNAPIDILEQFATGKDNELRMAVLSNPSLPFELRSAILEQLVGVSPSPVDNVWTCQRVARVSEAELNAGVAGDFLHYCGKDPNKAVLAKRPLAPLMALCAGPYIEPSRLARVVGSTDWMVRAAVARNGGTPPNLLKKLSVDPHTLVAALAIRAQAGTEAATKGEMTAMSDSPASGKGIAAANLQRAVSEIVKRLRKRELWDRMMADSTWSDQAKVLDVWHALPDEALESLEGTLSESLRILMWEIGATSPNEDVRRRIAAHQSCPSQALEILASDKSNDVLGELLQRSALPDSLQAKLIKAITSLRGEKLLDVLRSRSCSSLVLAELVGRADSRVRASLAGNPMAPKNVLETLAKDEQMGVRDNVAGNPATPAPVLDLLAGDSEMGVRRSVARNSATTSEVLERLGKDQNQWVRYAVAKNPATPPAMLETLSADVDVREAVVANPSTPKAVLAVLADDENLSEGAAWNQAVPLTLRQRALENLTKDQKRSPREQEWVREQVAKCVATSEHVLLRLASDPEYSVRRGVAENTSTPPSILEQLAVDPDRWVKLSVAKNSATPAGVRRTLLEALTADDHWNVRCDLAEDPNTPPELLAVLAADPNQKVRFAVASNPSTPSASLTVLAADSDEQICRAAAVNPAASERSREHFIAMWKTCMLRALEREVCTHSGTAPPAQIEPKRDDILRALTWLDFMPWSADNKDITKASRSKDWLTRLGAALHPGASAGILKLLQQDSDPDVAVAASRSLASMAGLA